MRMLKASPRRPLRGTAGFSLIEMLGVIALIAALAGVMIVAVVGLVGRGEEDLAKTFVTNAIKTPLFSYRMDVGSYPTTEQGLQALVTAPSGVGSRWRGPYLESRGAPVDPWQRPYQYRFPGTRNPGSYDVWSLGPDGVESADDIGNWETE